MSNKNRIKKHCTFEQDTFQFIEGYAKSLGGETFVAANEKLVRLGATNIEAIELQTEKTIAAIQSLENKLEKIEERFLKFENRTAALNVSNIKLAGSIKQLVSASIIEQNILSETMIDMEIKRGIKFAIEDLANNKKEKEVVRDPYEL